MTSPMGQGGHSLRGSQESAKSPRHGSAGLAVGAIRVPVLPVQDSRGRNGRTQPPGRRACGPATCPDVERSTYLWVALLLFPCLAMGCGDKDGIEPPGGTQLSDTTAGRSSEGPPTTRSAGRAQENGQGGGVEPLGPDSRDPDGVLRGRTAVATPGGGYYYAPIKPRATRVEPGYVCKRELGGGEVMLRPPAPGLSAQRLGPRLVVLDVDAQSPPRCSPKYIRVTFDVNDDPVPPASSLISVGRLDRPLRVLVPTHVAHADVVAASSIMGDGLSSDSVKVSIVD